MSSKINISSEWELDAEPANDQFTLRNTATSNEFVFNDDGSTGFAGGVTEVDMGTITLTSGSTPAFDGTINGVSTDEQKKIVDVAVIPDSTGQVAADYAWNISYSRAWDNSVPELDLDLTVNWDTDPGSNLTVRVFVMVQ